MKLTSILPLHSLEKSHRLQNVSRNEIDNFKTKYDLLFNRFSEKESEENAKIHLMDFLKSVYYEPDYLVATKGKTDFVIHTSKENNSPVGVLFEVKRPVNKSDMITQHNLNKKAMHELVLYYLRERIDNKNNDIRNCIITNIYEWYIFDAKIFEKIFYENKGLVAEYKTWVKGQKSSDKNDLFYNEIAKEFLSNLSDEIRFTHIDLRNYANPVTKSNSIDEKKLLTLYKLLSPKHLLKIYSTTDSNNLNPRFYQELLHIIGLEEVKSDNKNIIRRKEVGKRNNGSLLENTITTLETEDILRQYSNYGSNQEERAFNLSLELCITWINRILFLKLLESQLANYHRNNNYLFLNISTTNDFDALNKLFFQVLALKNQDRTETIKNKFSHIPYLNSSLFEVSEIERSSIRVNSLDNSINLQLYQNSVLKNNPNFKKGKENSFLSYLFSFLDSYNFSSESRESITDEGKTLINASVLGLIFEKINGYKEGSFYTPGFITEYICRESIRKTIISKFNAIKKWNCYDFTSLYNKIEDAKEANQIINEIKICDPAVGSGHFLVSALNELLAIKSELGILEDENGKRIRDYSINIVNDELIILNKEGDTFEYLIQTITGKVSPELQRVQKTIFHEKQSLIENCLFGVDINPNSVKICRLRLWIELLKHAYYTEESGFTELETLPNIDINIKLGNSLLSKFSLNEDLNDVFKKNKKFSLKAYKAAVRDYKEAKTKDAKGILSDFIKEIKDQFRITVNNRDPKRIYLASLRGQRMSLDNNINLFGEEIKDKVFVNSEKSRLDKLIKVESEKIFEIENNTLYKDSFEWRFEFPEVLDEDGLYIGFDVCIGNPPYIYNRDLPSKEREYYKSKYEVSDDLYSYFTSESIKLTKSGGIISFITPNTYFTLSSKEHFRALLLKFAELKLTYCGFVFKDAYVETQIFNFKKFERAEEDKIEFVLFPNNYLKYNTLVASYNLFASNFLKRFFWPTTTNLSLFEKYIKPTFSQSETFRKALLGKDMSDFTEFTVFKQDIKPNELILLGLISEGAQGLVTGNNSKYIGVIADAKEDENSLIEKFLFKFNKFNNSFVSKEDFIANEISYYAIAEEIKTRSKKPGLFGKFFNYKIVKKSKVKHYDSLDDNIKKDGGEPDLWVYYNRGNSEGYRWSVPYQEAISWSKESVKELREGLLTNSRWQGEEFFNTSGFGWVDYFTDNVKCFYIEAGVYSKNIVKLRSNINLSNKVIVTLINSKFISYFVKNFLTATHTLQINDGRLIPIMIPDKDTCLELESIFDEIIELQKLNQSILDAENRIDVLVHNLYNLTKEEIFFINDSSPSAS